ncbi:MAG TPA: ATP-binding protein [Pyrinomonadaceae bacterium]|nr:ATP-binding protein [Pyrinomonadaceae bacterium]
MNPLRYLASYISAFGLSLLAGLAVFLCWHLAALPTFPPVVPFLNNGVPPPIVPTPQLAAAGIVLFSLVVGLSVKGSGIRACWLYLLGTFLCVILVSVVVARFFGVDLLLIPLLVAGVLSLLLVQVNSLWQLDRQLSTTLFSSLRGSELVQPDEAKIRLASGLKLLSAVLPFSEAVVFQSGTPNDLQTVARLKGGTGPLTDPSRNSVWRDGIRLCERAVSSGQLVLETVDARLSNVAVPLRHEQETVGVLLLRLKAAFCDDDRPLLEAVGAQFARNLKRDSFSKNSFHSSLLSYFSTFGSEKKRDALHVLRALTTEQRCEASALTCLNDGVAIAYLDGTLASANSVLLEFAEVKPEQSKTLDMFSLLDRFRTDVFDEPALAVRRVLQTGIDYEGEVNFDQRNLVLGLRISLLRETQDQAARPVGLAILVRDLSKIKEYEKLKSDLISLMSHELRTPLTSINGFAELLTGDCNIPEQAREFVSIIANESQRMSRMINTFLAVTQLQRKDKQEVLKIPLRLDEVVRDTITTLQPIAKKKRIRLIEQPAHRLPPVAADKSLITQAVKNLLNNAIKYSPERTTVTISTALEAESVRVSVEDRGFGIPAESRDRVWEKFYRVVREGQEKDEESTGLGLSFVREVIEQHGGSVAVVSEEGRGSKFSFTLPRL